MGTHNLTEGDWDDRMKEHIGSGDRRPSTSAIRLGKPMLWLLLLFCACVIGATFLPRPKPWEAKTADEWARQIVAESNAGKVKRKTPDDGVLTGISETMREFNVRGKKKPQPAK